LSIIVCLGLVACGPSAPPTPTLPTPTATPLPTPTPTPKPPEPTPTPSPKAVETIILGVLQEPTTLHPMLGEATARNLVNAAVFAACTRQDDKLEWVPEACESVPTLENGEARFVGDGVDKHLEVTFKLKKGWAWHDGTPVRASDYVFTWKLALDPDLDTDRSFAEKLFDVVAVDSQTVVYKFMSEKQLAEAAAGKGKFPGFKLDYADLKSAVPSGPVVDPLYFALGSPLPEHILGKVPAKDQAKNDLARKPVGNGAYQLKDWKAGREIVLEANPKFLLGAPKTKTVVIRFIPDANAILAALRRGEIDGATQIDLNVALAPELGQIEKAGYKVWYVPGLAWERLDINTKFPLDDVKVRQALAYAIDRQEIIDKLYQGKAEIQETFFPKFHWAYSDDIAHYAYDVDKAKALLKEGGWNCVKFPCVKTVKQAGKDVTKKLEFTLVTTDQRDRQLVAQMLQSQMTAAGFGVNLLFLYGSNLFAAATAGGPLVTRTFDVAQYAARTGDAADVNRAYACNSIPSRENNFAGQNYAGWCNPEADPLITSALNAEIAVLREKQKPLLARVQKIWTTDVPVIPLYNYPVVHITHPGLKNWKPTPADSSPVTWNAWQWELFR